MGAGFREPAFFTTLVGFGFASVLGTTRGGVANVGNSLPHFVLGGHPPCPLPRGLRPPGPPDCLPSLAEGLPEFLVHSQQVCRGWKLIPSL